MKKSNIVQLFRLLLAVLFIFSSISKILSLPFFDSLVAKLLIGNNYYDSNGAYLFIQWLTRLLIALEMLLGVAILQNKYLKRIILPATSGLLIVFTIHLFYEGFTDKFIGGNCGCFGDIVPLDNFESIIKNMIALILVAYIWMHHKKKNEMRFRSWVFSVVVGIVTLGTLLLTVKSAPKKVELKDYTSDHLEAIESIMAKDTSAIDDTAAVTVPSTETKEEKVEEVAPKEKVTEEKEPVKEKPIVKTQQPRTIFTPYSTFEGVNKKVNIDEGRKMICMFSLTCGHCQEAYRDICAMADQGGFPPIYMFLYGDSDDQLTYFLNQAGCKHPYVFIKDYLEFERLLEGKDFPRIMDRAAGKNLYEWDLGSYSKESLAEYYGLDVPQEQEEDNGLGF